MPRKNNNKKRVARRRNPVTALPSPAYPMQARLRVRIGFFGQHTFATASGNVFTLDANVVGSWSSRFPVNWRVWRMVGWSCNVQPVTNAGGLYSAAQFDTIQGSLPTTPTSHAELLELPQGKLAPCNQLNQKATTRYRWRSKDIEALLFQSTSTLTELYNASGMQIYCDTPGSIMSYNGWIDVEFKDMVDL